MYVIKAHRVAITISGMKMHTWYLVFLNKGRSTKKKIEVKLRIFKDTAEKLFQIIAFKLNSLIEVLDSL